MVVDRSLSLLLLVTIIVSCFQPVYSSMNYRDGMNRFMRSIVVYAPAVTRGGGGALIRVNLTLIYPGSGRVFFSAQPLVELDTQATARIAAYVAARVTGYDYYSYDYVVDMTANSLVVGGPSAGGLITIGFIALFLNKTLNPWITMTGMINPDGSIGPVGGLLGKLEAVAMHGYKVFLIPLGQRTVLVEKRIIKRYLWGYYETIRYEKVDLVEKGRELGVSVIEVSNILEAMKYFLNTTYRQRITNPVIPHDILRVVNKYAVNNTVTAWKLYNESLKEYSRLDFFTQLQLHDRVTSLRNKLYFLEKLLRNNASLAAYMEAENILVETYDLYWTLKYINNEIDLDHITGLVNETINKTYILSEKHGEKKINLLSLEAYGDYYLAIHYLFEAIEKGKTGNVGEEISYLSRSIVLAMYTQQLLNLSLEVPVNNSIGSRNIYTLYSLADSVISYAYSLSQDISTSNDYIDTAVEYFNYAGNALETNNTLASIPLLIHAIAYADIGIEELFIDNISVLGEIAQYLRNNSLTYLGLSNESIYSLKILIGDQYLSNGLVDKAMIYYVEASLYILILAGNMSLPSPIPVKPVIPRVNPSKQPSNTNILLNTPNELIDYILGVLTGVLLTTLILLITRIKSIRKNIEKETIL